MERFAELSRRAATGFAVATLVVFAFWSTYHLLDDEWDPASYGGRDYSCAGPGLRPHQGRRTVFGG